jgi:glycosyltransferase involved in cell wall biosynthesis
MNSPMTILQVISQRHLSGAERVCLMLSESLLRRGHRVVLLCKRDEAMLAEAAQRGIETRTPGLSGKFNPLVALGILRIAREVGADVIHTHLSTASQWGGVAGRLGGIPVVSHVHAMNSRYFFLLADAMVACSEGVRQHIIGQGVSTDRISTIYNGIESKRLQFSVDAVQMRTSLGLAADTPAIACIAHLADKKGQADLIKAVVLLSAKWPDLHCFFVGTGENMDSLRRQAEALGVGQRALLLGYRNDAVAIMNAMNCVLLPSLGKEGLPLVLLEAALLGKPAICSNIPGNNEVVLAGVTGLLFPPGDAEELADRIDAMLSDREQCRRMGNAARERAEREFTIEAMTERVELLYSRLMK